MRNVFRVMVVLLVFAACGEGGEPPEVCQTHAEQSIEVGESVDLVMCFTDPNALSMTYSAASSDLMVVTAEMSAEVLTIEAIAPGSATVTVTARNSEDQLADAVVAVSVPNEPPVPCEPHAEQSIRVGESVDLVMCFVDPYALSMTYSAASSDTMVITAEMSAEVLTIEAIGPGSATVTVTAINTEGLAADAVVAVSVLNESLMRTNRKLPPIYLRKGDDTTKKLSRYATDSEGSELTFTAISANTSVMTAIVRGAKLTLTGLSIGSTTVTVTASNSAGEELDMTVPAEVYSREDWQVVDQFDRGGNWRYQNEGSLSSLRNSELELWSEDADFWFAAVIMDQAADEDWSMEALVAQLDSLGLPGMLLDITDGRYRGLIFQVGEDVGEDGKTYQLLLFDAAERAWVIIEDGSGDDVEVEVGEYFRIGMGQTNGEFWVAVGEHRLTPTMPDDIRWGSIDVVGLTSWQAIDEEPAGRITVDWTRIKAIDTGPQPKVIGEPSSLPDRIGRVRSRLSIPITKGAVK